VEPLLDELRSEDPSHLRMIVRILARIESPATGEALAELLRRPLGPKLRARVVDALLRVRDGSHVDVVLPYLEHDDPWVRKTAVDYLGAFADPSVMPGVLLRVQDSEEWTREAALRVVERLQEGSEVPEAVRERLRDRFPFVRAAAVRVFCAARDFQTLLDDEVTEELAEPSVRRAFLEGMRHRANATSLPLLLRISAFSGDTDLPRLEDLAREVFASMEPAEVQAELERACERPAQPSQRWLAATALPFVPAADRAARLEGFVGDSDPRVRAAAIAGMAATSADHGLATATVIAALQDPAPLVVKAGILAASWSGQDALRSSLRRCLRHADPSVRRDAALAAGFVDDARMTSALRSTSLDREPGPRVAGVLARLHLGQRDAMADWIEILRDDALREEFESLLEQDHRILRRLLAAHRPEEQEWVGRLMGCRTPFEAERALLEALDTSRDENLRTMAVDGLERLDTERAHGRIVSSLLKDQSPRVRARALRYVVERNVFDRREHFLREALRDPVETVQVQAVHLCICLEERVAVSLLSQHLGTRRRRLRAAVSDLLAGYLAEDLEWAMDFLLGQEATEEFLTGLVETLAKVAVPLTTELLELLFLHRRAHTRAHALRALLPRLAQGRWPHIRRALDDPSPTVRLEALRHLGRQEVDDPSLRDELHGLLDRLRQDPSPALRARVALVLGAHDIEGSERWLAELARDPHARVARAGQKAQQRRRDEPVGVSS
jgi:HEAT repeat protein